MIKEPSCTAQIIVWCLDQMVMAVGQLLPAVLVYGMSRCSGMHAYVRSKFFIGCANGVILLAP